MDSTGPTEISVVTEIAIGEWKLRRAHRAELGEIRRRIFDAPTRDPIETIALARELTPELVPEVSRRSSTGINLIQFAVGQAIGEIETTGRISRKACDRLDKVFGGRADSPTELLKIWFFDEMPDSLRKSMEETPLPEGAKPDKKAAALELLEYCWKDLQRLKRKVRQREKLSAEIELQRLRIPNGPELERLQRYVIAIKRDLHRSIELLERLQRRRRGEPAAPTVNVNLSRDD